MFKNYLMVAVRNLMRHRVYSLINVFGLAVGMACCILILLFIRHEFSYDRHHEKVDRIYKVLRQKQRPDGEIYYSAGTLGPVAPTMQQEFPEVERATRFINRPMWIHHEDQGFTERAIIADREFVNIFDYDLVEGAVADLQKPYAAFVTQRLAKKLFGSADPIGKVVSVSYKWLKGDFTIAGILEDVPETSVWELECDFLTLTMPLSQEGFNWKERLWEHWSIESNLHPMRTYLLLKPKASVTTLAQKLPDFALRYLKALSKTESYVLTPLNRFHLYGKHEFNGLVAPGDGKPLGDYRRSYIFGVIGFFVLVIACINFMNLATARSARRAREVGMRKVVGAYRGQIIGQFMGESVLLSLVALVLAIGMSEILLPIVNGYLGFDLMIDGWFLGQFLGLALVVGVFAGSYPALFLSSFRPTVVLKSTRTTAGGHGLVRKGLVVIQFAISIVLIVGTLVAFRQIEYMRNTDIGFEREARLIMPLMKQDRSLRWQAEKVKQQVLTHSGILGATTSLFPPGEENNIDVRQVSAPGLAEPMDVHIIFTDEDFIDVYGIQILEGRSLLASDKPVLSDNQWSNVHILFNESAAKLMGNIQAGDDVLLEGFPAKVAGIFKDFHNRSLHHEIRPLMLIPFSTPDYITVKFNAGNLPDVMAHLESVWKTFLPDRPFEYQFLDDYLDTFYQTELKLRQLYAACTGLAIVIACLGLLGLIAYTAEVRTKEIGVRKVLGATEMNLVGLLTREFLILVGVASVLAWPMAWFLMEDWLENFAYHIDLNPLYFVGSTLLALVITLVTIGYQALKAARINPIDALRYE